MPRFVWARVWCDLLEHRNFRKRPDCDIRLVVGLILYAKKHSGDAGLIEGLDAEEMRGLFGIKASTQRVQEGLEYLLRIGWLQLVDDHGSYVIKDFIERQTKTDSSEAQKARAQRYYASHKDAILTKRKFSRGLTSEQPQSHALEHPRSHAGLTALDRDGLTPQSHADVDEDEDPRSARSSKDGESEGKDTTACESVDNPQAIPANLSESERSHVLKLWKDGKGSDATAFLASIQRKRGAL
jgi:hypothetical protein